MQVCTALCCAVLRCATQMQCLLMCRIWLSYLNPIFWTVYGLIESQVDNLSSLVLLNDQRSVPVYEAVEILFGYQ